MHAGNVIIPDLEWWQTLAAVVGALGLSPAPWIFGLALGRLQFSAPAERAYNARLEANDAGWQRSYDELKESRDTYREAWENERDGRATATVQLAEVTKAAATTVAAVTDAAFNPKEGAI